MATYHRKFDANAYWATKPLCTVCKIHKVKSGTVCSKCRNIEIRQLGAEIKEAKTLYQDSPNMKQTEKEILTPNIGVLRDYQKKLLISPEETVF